MPVAHERPAHGIIPAPRPLTGELAVRTGIRREQLHKAGKHQESVDTLAKAMKILKI